VIIRNATKTDLYAAINLVNEKYDNNIVLNETRIGKTRDGRDKFNVRLTVKDSHGKGARIGYTGRHLINACWHAHGNFFDTLLYINHNVTIKALNRTIYMENGKAVNNWIDRNIGSYFNPLNWSAACECQFSTKKLKLGKFRIELT